MKLDGFRTLAYVEGGRARLVSRNGNTFKSFPELTAAIGPALGVTNAVLDGEIVHLGRDGKPQFYCKRQSNPLCSSAATGSSLVG